MSVSVVTVRALVGELARRNLPWTDLLASIGLTEEGLSDAEMRVGTGDFHRLAEQAIVRADDPTIGLEAGLRAPLTTLRVLGPLLLTSQNLRSALESLMRFLPVLVQGAEWHLTEDSEHAVISYEPPHPRGVGSRFCAEFSFAMASRIGTAIHGERGAVRTEVRFAHPSPGCDDVYVRAFGCPVRFGMNDNAIVIPRARIDSPQLNSDVSVRRDYEHTAEQLLHNLSGTRADGRVRAFLREQRDLGGLDQSVIASKLGYSARTLRRRLSDEGTSVTRLLDDARAERARAELTATEPSVKAIASRLGFASAQAFHRAFMRWTGQTPGAFVRAVEETRAARRSPSDASTADARAADARGDAVRKRTA